MGTFICWWGQRSHIKVKGHLRSRCKIENVKVTSFENLKSDWNQTWFVDTICDPLQVCSCSQRSYTKVRGHQRSSCKMGSKCKIHLIWKVEIHLKLNLVYWYNVGTFTCSWGQRSPMNVKGHVRSTCKINWKCKIWLFCILEDQLEPCDPNRCRMKVRCQFIDKPQI